MQKEEKKEKKKKDKKEEYFNFGKELKLKNKESFTELELKKEIINYFNVTDYRVINNKKSILLALGVIRELFYSKIGSAEVVYIAC